MGLDERPVREPNAAGIEMGAREILVAVPSERDENRVRVFWPFSEDRQEMAQGRVHCGSTTVAMESTGVYWIRPHHVWEPEGVKPG